MVENYYKRRRYEPVIPSASARQSDASAGKAVSCLVFRVYRTTHTVTRAHVRECNRDTYISTWSGTRTGRRGARAHACTKAKKRFVVAQARKQKLFRASQPEERETVVPMIRYIGFSGGTGVESKLSNSFPPVSHSRSASQSRQSRADRVRRTLVCWFAWKEAGQTNRDLNG